MGMQVGAGGPHKAEINMTPMIDILLVLIIIFMVITPIAPRGLEALLPQPAPETATVEPGRHDIVITVSANGQVRLNEESMDLASLEARLLQLFKTGANDVVFLRGDKELAFSEIARVLDLSRSAGVRRVGLMTR